MGARSGTAILASILVVVGFISALMAYEKPLWSDEICTVIVSRLAGASEIWNALDNAADTNPPGFYFFTRLGRQIVADDHLGYRLPSILGLLGTLACLYAILCRRVDRLSALVGAAFVLSTPLVEYGYEARPYALLVCCIAAAILAWQRIEDSRLYAFALMIALATALSVHYYAILVWPAFVLAEAVVWFLRRRLRVGVWLALASGAIPLFLFRGLALHLRQYYGQNFWIHPSLGQILTAPNYLFNVMGFWGISLTIGAIAVLVWWSVQEKRLPMEDCAIIVTLLMLPAIAVVAAKISGGGMTPRYMMPTILGGALAVGYLTGKAAPAARALLLVIMLVNYGLPSISILPRAVKGTLLARRAAAEREATSILAKYRGYGLPILISNGLQYLPMAYYMREGEKAGLSVPIDPAAAVVYSRTDSVDLALVALAKYFPLNLVDYRRFSSEHGEFIMVSDNGGRVDWWPLRLMQEGHAMSLLSMEGSTQVYRVVIR